MEHQDRNPWSNLCASKINFPVFFLGLSRHIITRNGGTILSWMPRISAQRNTILLTQERHHCWLGAARSRHSYGPYTRYRPHDRVYTEFRLLCLGIQSATVTSFTRAGRKSSLRIIRIIQDCGSPIRRTRPRCFRSTHHGAGWPGLQINRINWYLERWQDSIKMCTLAYMHCWPGMPMASPKRLSDWLSGEILGGYELFKRNQCCQDITDILATDRWAGRWLIAMDIHYRLLGCRLAPYIGWAWANWACQ